MKHIEVSRKINLRKKHAAQELKASLVERLEKTMEIESIAGTDDKFTISGTTGTPSSITRHARLDLDVSVKIDGEVAKIIFSGYARAAVSLTLFYTCFFLLFLGVGLLPGAISSGAESGPLDVLVFLVLGIFVLYDTNRKLSEPREYIGEALQSLDTEFG
jgi:hypothetical protein